MNSKLERLEKLLARERAPAKFIGTIVEANGQAIKVRSSRGLVEARSVDATIYSEGDEVLVDRGIVQGRVKRTADVPVYNV